MIPLLANPWLLLAAVLALGASHTFAYVKGGISRENSILAEQKRQDELVQKVQQSTAQQIAKIEVVNKTIYQRATREVIEKPVYRDCHHDADTLGMLNHALTNTAPAEPAGDSSMSGADATSR
jgi:hypothetical protein